MLNFLKFFRLKGLSAKLSAKLSVKLSAKVSARKTLEFRLSSENDLRENERRLNANLRPSNGSRMAFAFENFSQEIGVYTRNDRGEISLSKCLQSRRIGVMCLFNVLSGSLSERLSPVPRRVAAAFNQIDCCAKPKF